MPSAFSPKLFGSPDSLGKWGQMWKTSTAVLMCIIPIVLIKYVTIRQTIHTQHCIIVIQKAMCFRLHVTTIVRLAVIMAKIIGSWWCTSEYQTHYYSVGWACCSPQWSLLLIYVWPKLIHSVYCEYHIVLFISSYIECQISVSLTLLNIWQTTGLPHFHFLTTHIWPTSQQSGTFTVDYLQF